MRRTVWSEFAPFEVLRRGTVLSHLSKRRIGLYLAVAPGEIGGAVDVIRCARDHGVWIGVWPMLGDDAGRWAGGQNHGPFVKHATQLLGALLSANASPDGFALDLEPPVDEVRQLLRGRLRPWRHRFGRRSGKGVGYDALLRSVEDAGVETLATVIPVLSADGSRRGFERFFDTPLSDVEVCRVCPMAYSSLFEGYSRGRLSRGDALALVGVMAQAVRRRYLERASLALGIVGRGAIGDEASYRGVDELCADVSAARATGVDDLVLHDLAGILSRPPVEAWLDAFVYAEAREPAMTIKARTVAGSTWALSRVLGIAPHGLRRPR